jgi:hypothetical protein
VEAPAAVAVEKHATVAVTAEEVKLEVLQYVKEVDPDKPNSWQVGIYTYFTMVLQWCHWCYIT